MLAEIDKYVLPGYTVHNPKSSKGVTILGPGLRQHEEKPNTISITQSGILKFRAPNTYWIEGDQKRYVPKRGDLVVGIVSKKAGEILKIDIGSAEAASLSMLAFEGATKKQKPDVQVGDVVYARVLNAHKEMEPDLVCVDQYFKAKRLGILPDDGFLFNISLKLSYSLLNIENPLLRTLGKRIPFEIAIGVNGKVWLKCKESKSMLTIIKAFEAAEKCLDKDVSQICNQIR